MEALIQLVMVALVIGVGFFAGTYNEKRHYKSIIQREKEFLNLPAMTTSKKFNSKLPVESARLVTGSVVISVDAFKRMLAGLRNFFGGEVGAYETLIDRARREAILRMKEQAGDADVILNMRLETSSIGGQSGDRDSVGSIEAYAYGTAVKIKKSA